MRTSNLKTKLSLTLIALACLVGKTALAAPDVILDNNDYLRVTIPQASLANSRLVYASGDNKVEAFPQDGEVVSLHAEWSFMNQPILGHFLFTAEMDDQNNFNLQVTATDPIGYDMIIGFASNEETAFLNTAGPLVFEAVDAKVEVVTVPNGQDEIGLPPAVLNGDETEFKMEGVLDIRFVVKAEEPADDQGNGNADQNPGEGDGNVEGNGNAASGGCSMIPGAAHSQATLILAGLGLALPMALRRKRK